MPADEEPRLKGLYAFGELTKVIAHCGQSHGVCESASMMRKCLSKVTPKLEAIPVTNSEFEGQSNKCLEVLDQGIASLRFEP